jgi:hypothetical protein
MDDDTSRVFRRIGGRLRAFGRCCRVKLRLRIFKPGSPFFNGLGRLYVGGASAGEDDRDPN